MALLLENKANSTLLFRYNNEMLTPEAYALKCNRRNLFYAIRLVESRRSANQVRVLSVSVILLTDRKESFGKLKEAGNFFQQIHGGGRH